MEEGKKIARLFSAFYSGDPWTDVRMSDILQGVTAEQAGRRVIPNANTIWQLVQHCVGWRENVLRKLQGEEFKSPDDNYLSPPENTGEQEWKKLLLRLETSEKNWEEYLLLVADDELEKGYKPAQNKFTQYEVIHGILHHDNYHFGQIVMLKKLL